MESWSALMKTVGIGWLDLDLVTVQEITRGGASKFGIDIVCTDHEADDAIFFWRCIGRGRLRLLLRWQCARSLPGDSELDGRVVP